MVLHCVIPECKNSSHTPGISLHRFPNDENKKRAWFLRMRRYFKETPAMRICSAHFLPEDYKHISKYRKCLKDSAEPSVFPYEASQESVPQLGLPLNMPKSSKEVKTWGPPEKIVVPPLEEFLEVPLEYIRNKKKASRYFQLKKKTAEALLPFRVQKNVPDTCAKKETTGIIHPNFNQSRTVNDPQALKWLKRSKKTKKTFINYFACGMSPAVAIKHHESMLCFENPDLVNDNKRNPPTSWVYSLYDSWLRENEEKITVDFKNFKQRISDQCDSFFMETNTAKVSVKQEIDPVTYQNDLQVPCVIHMKDKPIDDYEDLKYLMIPDEVKELFFMYFNDGLNVSEAMKLNEENLKRYRNWPQFNPSERVVNYIYKNWHQQIKSCEDSSRDSGFISLNEKNYIESNLSFESFWEQTDCQNMMDNFTATSNLTTNSCLKESVSASQSQAEKDCSLKSSMKILSFPFIPPNKSSSHVKSNHVVSKVSKSSPLQAEEKLHKKMPISTKVDMLEHVQNKFTDTDSQNLTTNSCFKVSVTVSQPQTKVENSLENSMEILPLPFIHPNNSSSLIHVDHVESNNVATVVSTSSPVQIKEELHEKIPVSTKVNNIFDSVQNEHFTTSSKNLHTNSCFKQSVTVFQPQAEVDYSLEKSMEILSLPFIPPNSSSSLTHVESNDMVTEVSKSSPVQQELHEKLPVSTKVNNIFDPVQNEYITTSFQNLNTNSCFKQSGTVSQSQAEVDYSLKKSMEILSLPFVPPYSSSPETHVDHVESNNVVTVVSKRSPVQIEEELHEKIPVSTKIDKIFDPMQNEHFTTSSKNLHTNSCFKQSVTVFQPQAEVDYSLEKSMEISSLPLIPPNSSSSLTHVESNNMVTEVSKSSPVQQELHEKITVSTKVDNIFGPVQNEYITTSSQNLNTNSCFKQPVTVCHPQAEVDYSLVKSVDISSLPFAPANSSSPSTHVETNNVATQASKSYPLQTEEKLLEKMQISTKIVNIFHPVQNQFTATGSQNSVAAPFHSVIVPVNSLSIESDYINNAISAVSVMTKTNTLNTLKNSSGSFYAEKPQELSSSLNKPYYCSDFSNKYSFQSESDSSRLCQITFSDSFNEVKVSNYYEPPVMKDPNIFYPSTIYGSNVSFEVKHENVKNEHHFYQFVDKDGSEFVTRMPNEVKDFSHIYSATHLDSSTNVFSSWSPTHRNGCTILKEMPNRSKINNFMEFEESNYIPDNMSVPPVHSRNNELAMSFTDEDYGELSGTGNLKIAPLELSKQNEDQQFLMSLLPEFECIPDSFKVTLKYEIFHLVRSTKLRANKRKIEEI